MKESETYLPLVTAVHRVTGRRPHLSTVLRWCQRPTRHGVRLQSWVIGGRRLTTTDAAERYIEATTHAADEVAMPFASDGKLAAKHEAAIRELQDLGL